MNDASDSYNKKLAQLSPEEKRALLAKLLREKAQAATTKDWSSLSHGQRALWFLYRLAPASPAYNLLYAARIRSALDLPALGRAVQSLVRRYPILTASYGTRDGEPVQRVHPDTTIPVEVVEAASWNEEELKKEVSAEGHRPFDLENGPVLRLKLFTHGAQDAVLALTAHHIAVDFWALDILVEELGLLYIAELVGEPAALPSPGTQHDDYVEWQAEMLKGPEGERLWDYWRQELAGELPLLNLPLDHPRPPVQTYDGATYSFPIEEQITKRLRELANGERATLYMVLLAAFQVLLYRYSQQESLLLGTTALGRNRPDLERVIGYLANPVVLRADFSGNPTFRDFLRGAREKVIGALEHQDFPFPLLVERLQPKRDPSYSPLFQVLFIWDKMRSYGEQDSNAFARSGLHLEPFLFGQLGAPFDLSLTIFEMVSGLTADFHYNVDLFESATIERLGRHFHALLSGIAANPDQSLLDLPLLTPEEQRTMLVEWNATQSLYPARATLHQLIEEQVTRTPGALAVSFEGQTLTYDELNRRANQLAHALRRAGVDIESRVGVCMERSLEMAVALLAVLKSGGAYVPLDPGYPQERLAYMLEDAQVPVLLTQTAIQAQLPRTGVVTICLDTFWEGGRDEPETNPQVTMQPGNMAYMIYTSGSTGKPKGVMNTHRGIVNRLHWMQQTYQLTAVDRVMQKTPFSFDVSVWEFFWPLLSGARLVVARPGGHQDTHYLASLISEQQITTMHFVPSMLQAFLLESDLEERCRSLKRVFCSGEVLPSDLQERFFTCFPHVALHNLYGPTEAAIDVTYWECQRGRQETTVPIGRPIANTQIYLLDAARHLVPIGVPGELYIGGVGVARGYFRRPELTREKFIADPFSDQAGARLFRTGDLARYRADGAIEFLGRIDHQVKIRGFRIELEEIEAALAQHPAVKEAVVTAREDTPGNKRLVAYIVPATSAGATQTTLLSPQEAGISMEELRAFLKEHLPYYMVPATFLFLAALPLMPNGKLDRKALPAPDSTRPDLQSTFVAPRTPLETQLVGIWAQVLDLDKIGIHDNFFDLGGASIQSLEIIAKANEAGIPLVLEMLFEFQTIAELAEAIEQKQSSVAAPGEQPGQKAAAVQPQSPAAEVITSPAPAYEQPGENAQGNTYIESMGVYLPPKIVSTDDIMKGCAKPIRFPLARLSGIKNRRMAGETEFSIDLAKKAIADCLANSKYNPEDIDMLVCGNISRYNKPDMGVDFEPSTAVQLKRYFGFKNAIVFDLDNACTGLFTAAYIVDSFIQAGIIRRGLAVSGEYITHILETAQKELEGFMDSRLPCLTVGDAGAAMLLERAPDKKVGFHAFELFTLGRYSEDCIGKLSNDGTGSIMYTDAVRVSAVNMTHAVAHAATIIKRSGWPLDVFKHIIPHQTSNTTIRDAARAINDYFGAEVCTQENVINNIAERANTATTTHVVAMMDNIRSGRIQSGENAVLGITGSGATIGAAIYTFDDLPDRIRRREAGEYTPVKVAPEPHPIAPVSLPGKRFRIANIGIVPADIEPSTLGMLQVAAENCLAASSYQRGDIDLLMFAGVYRDEFLSEPAVAALLAGKLQMNDEIESPTDKKTFALDIFNGAVGTLNACYAAMGMMRAGRFKNALVTASEVENNREQHPEMLLGIEETGSALLLDASPDGQTGFGNFVFKYATDYLDAYAVQIHRYNARMALDIQKDARIEDYYLSCIQEAVQELLRLERLDMSCIKLILPPQMSSEFIGRLGDTLGVERTKLVDVQAKRDLFTSSLAYSLHHVQEKGLAQPGDIGLIISAGSGIQVGCAIYYF